MNKAKIIITSLCLLYITTIHAESGQAYLDKFMTYLSWCQHLPTTPDPAFTAFIETKTPLTQKLREKWLYQLARQKDWLNYSQAYRDSTDTCLQCYAQIALYQQGKREQAIEGTKPLWLNGGSQPKACDELFTLLLTHHELSDELIHQRIALALEKRNVSLAKYLLKQYASPRLQEAEILTAISQNPMRITQLQPSPLHSDFYLYGLKLLVPRHLDQAIHLFETPKSKQFLNESQQQAFITQVALYKAMRNQPDAPQWFANIKPDFYTDALMDWEIRYALSHHQWHQVLDLIAKTKNKEEPSWQYWSARAYESLNERDKAVPIFQTLATKRNYYGFLASLKLKQLPQFENEQPTSNEEALAFYKPFTEKVQQLYASHQALTASRLLSDFSMELSKEERSALAYWVDHHLQWYGKSVYLSNNEQLNNQLALRFPLAYQTTVNDSAKHYQISPVLIYAMIRQESAFRDDIVSPAGANGLMQIMPVTAKTVARGAKIPYTDAKDLYSSQKNITIGAAYLKLLAHQFGAHPLLMAAAYNAGPRQVNFWLKNHPTNEIDIWIETLPWQETRNYLKNVIAFYAVYQYRMHEHPNLNAFLQPF